MSDLVGVLAARPTGDDLGAQIAWIQQAIASVDAAVADGSLEGGEAVATDLRASLGAIVAWGRGPRDGESLLQLQALISALLGRATSTLYRALATRWRAIAAAQVDDELDAAGLAAAFTRAAAAVEQGDEIPVDVVARLRRA
ncbi:MAG TPA: hypothetical protein VGF99_14615 [Myxococcota bacterium]